MPKNYCIMQIWAESGKSALPICNYSQILYQFLTFTQNLKRSQAITLILLIFSLIFLLTPTIKELLYLDYDKYNEFIYDLKQIKLFYAKEDYSSSN
jgi:hypothetical protein